LYQPANGNRRLSRGAGQTLCPKEAGAHRIDCNAADWGGEPAGGSVV